ncbi:MAG: WecB/TagA/CpsF family glycosyltransferase [Cyanobacteria bacterium SIG31]|nr:WecB/TagA/CpsF family glycosyltransferase [Cyanobacteria bacterium SIG31]
MSVELLGLNVDTYSFDEAIIKARELIDGKKVSQVITINPEMFEYSNKDLDFTNIVKEAEMVIPEGIGVKIALAINGHRADRIPGIDFARKLLEESAFNDIPVAIIGAKEDVIIKAVENLKKEISGLNIVYYHNGYFDDDLAIYNEIQAKSPKLILVALGSPRQEKFIYNAKKYLKASLMVGIGGSLDVWSGTLKRAPKVIQKLGLEWLYRTIKQPERFKRIFPTLPLFVLKAINYKFNK